MNWITKDLGLICVAFNLQPHDQENQCCLSEYIRKKGLCVSATVSARSECKVGLGVRVEVVLPTGKRPAASSSISCHPGSCLQNLTPALFCVPCCLTPCLLYADQLGILMGWLHWLPTLPLRSAARGLTPTPWHGACFSLHSW